MHDYHLWTLAHEISAERRAQADRERLARLARTPGAAHGRSLRAPRALRSRASLGALFRRRAFL